MARRPCAACTSVHHRCPNDCILALYFPSDNPQRFAVVRKVFGAANVRKILQKVPVDKREDAARSLVREADAREVDPVNGYFGLIQNEVSRLQNRVSELEKQLAVAEAQMNHEAVKGGKGKEAFETASGVAAGEIKHEAASLPFLLLELAIPTAKLIQDMGTGLMKIALECEKHPKEKTPVDLTAAGEEKE